MTKMKHDYHYQLVFLPIDLLNTYPLLIIISLVFIITSDLKVRKLTIRKREA